MRRIFCPSSFGDSDNNGVESETESDNINDNEHTSFIDNGSDASVEILELPVISFKNPEIKSKGNI